MRLPGIPNRLSAYPLGRVRVRCDTCRREGSWSLARLAVQHGAEVPLDDLLRILTAGCRWQRPPGSPDPRKYEPRCLAFYPDLVMPEPVPPSRQPLRVVGGTE